MKYGLRLIGKSKTTKAEWIMAACVGLLFIFNVLLFLAWRQERSAAVHYQILWLTDGKGDPIK